MSIILDALRKADAQRNSSGVPDLHAWQAPLERRGAGARRPWLGVALVVGLVVIALAIWLGSGVWRPRPPQVLGDQAAPAVRVAPAPPAAAKALTASGVPTTTAAPATSASPASPATAAKAAPAPAAVPGATPVVVERPVAPNAVAALPPATSRPAEPPRPLALNELPDDVRRSVPALNISGNMYSELRADRILIANGRLLHEGDALGPETVVEEIQPRAAVLGHRGYRVRVTW